MFLIASWAIWTTFWTFCQLYCDQLQLHLSHNKFFWLLPKRYEPLLEPSSYWIVINSASPFAWQILLITSKALWTTSWTIFLLDFDQLRLHLSHNKFFWLLPKLYEPLLQPSAYCTVINCAFTICRFNFLIASGALGTTFWMCLLYCDQQRLCLSHSKNILGFSWSVSFYLELIKHTSMFLNCTFICYDFKWHKAWNNTEWFSAPTSTIRTATANTFSWLELLRSHDI